jgi:hypothetical protein
MFCSSGHLWWSLFWLIVRFQQSHFIFVLSSKTEVGSAGEQPARDNLVFGINLNSCLWAAIYFKPMPSKTHL